MNFLISLTFIHCAFKIVYCRPGVYRMLDYSTDTTKDIIDFNSGVALRTLELGNRFVQFGGYLASKSLHGAESLKNYMQNLSTQIKMKLTSTKSSIFGYVIDKMKYLTEHVESRDPVFASVVKLLTILLQLMVIGTEYFELAYIIVDDFVYKFSSNLSLALGEIKIKTVEGLYTLYTLNGQLLITGIALLKKIVISIISHGMHKGLSYVVTPPESDSANHKSWWEVIKSNFASSVYSSTPHFVQTVINYFQNFLK